MRDTPIKIIGINCQCCRDSASGDFTLAAESPAWLLGISQVTRDERKSPDIGVNDHFQVDTESIGPKSKKGAFDTKNIGRS